MYYINLYKQPISEPLVALPQRAPKQTIPPKTREHSSPSDMRTIRPRGRSDVDSRLVGVSIPTKQRDGRSSMYMTLRG